VAGHVAQEARPGLNQPLVPEADRGVPRTRTWSFRNARTSC
jgi:hypothetical protein